MPAPDWKDLDRDQLEQALAEQTQVLRERLKELECLREIARLFDRRDAPMEAIFGSVAEAVVRAWQYPEITEARIVVGDLAHATARFRETPWSQTSPILVRGTPAGTLTVCYLEERPERDEGPFLSEERHLLDMVAQRLGGYIERREAFESLLRYQQELRGLASVLALTEQRERRRIAEGLHDRVGQNLALANMCLHTAEEHAVTPQVARAIGQARSLISQVIAETRSLTFELCPPILYELGLAPALDWVGEQFEGIYGYRVIVREHGRSAQLNDDEKAALFQASREILINAAKHGQATTVDVDIINGPNRFELVIKDNGCGFDPSRIAPGGDMDGGFGLFSIRERLRFLGGATEIVSTPGRGTTVKLTLPLRPTASDNAEESP